MSQLQKIKDIAELWSTRTSGEVSNAFSVIQMLADIDINAAQQSGQAGGSCTCPRSDTGSVLYYSQDCKVHALPHRP